jgi:hypothetical protein
MAVRSTSDAGKGLFIGIDELNVDGDYMTAFTVHVDRYIEAIGLIPLFCIILEAKFGIASRQWFTEESIAVDLKCKCVVAVPLIPDDDEPGFDLDSDDEHCSTMMDLLGRIDSSGTAKKGFEFNINYLIDKVAPSKIQFGDSGSVKTFRQECIEIDESEDDNETEHSTPGLLASADDATKEQQVAHIPSPDTRTIVVGNQQRKQPVP